MAAEEEEEEAELRAEAELEEEQPFDSALLSSDSPRLLIFRSFLVFKMAQKKKKDRFLK